MLISTYLSSLYNPSSYHNLLVEEGDVIAAEWIYNSLVTRGDDCISGCSYARNIANELNLVATLDDALGKWYNFLKDRSYTTYTSYSSWKNNMFGGVSNAQIAEEAVQGTSIGFLDQTQKVISLTFSDSDGEDPDELMTISYSPESGQVSVADSVYKSDFKYISALTYNPSTDTYAFRTQDYTCESGNIDNPGSGVQNDCIKRDGVNSSDLVLHTDITITVDSSSGKILSVSGKLYKYGELSSSWENQDEVNAVLANSGANDANGDYLDLSTISIDWNL